MGKYEEDVLVEEVDRLIYMIKEECANGKQTRVTTLADELEKALNLLIAYTHKEKKHI